MLLALGLGFASCRVVYDFPAGEAAGAGGSGGAAGVGGASSSSAAAAGGGGSSICGVPPEHVHSATFGGDEVDEVTSLVVEPLTNAVYATGYTESASFGLPSGASIPGGNDVYNDMFLLKLAPDGDVAWAKVLGTTSPKCSASYRQRGQAVAADPHGNVVVVGRFDCTLDFSAGGSDCEMDPQCLVASGASPTSPTPPPDIFVAELDPDGYFLWAHAYGDAPYSEDVWDMSVDPAGRVVLIGKYAGAMNLGVPPLETSDGEHRGFVAVLDDQGNGLWSRYVRHVCNASNALTCRVATDSAGGIYWEGDFAGDYTGDLYFGDYAPEKALKCPCTAGGFRVKYGPDGGDPAWQFCTLQACDAGSSFIATDMVVSPDGSRLIVVGRLRGTVDFGLGPVTAQDDDAVLLEIDPASGVLTRVERFGGAEDQVFLGVSFDAQAGLSLVGNMWGTLSAEPCVIAKAEPKSPWADAFLLHVDANYQADWARSFGNGGDQGARAVSVAPDGSLVLGARVQGILDLGGGPLPNHGMSDDVLIARLRPVAP